VEAKAKTKYIRTTARKARLVADAIRGKGVGEALSMLTFSIHKDVGEDFSKILKSAVANLQNKQSDQSVDVDELVVKEVQVGQGPVMKRFRARAQGRAYRILKRMCHITVTVAS
jgi:large subunit ribosomal protein L22